MSPFGSLVHHPKGSLLNCSRVTSGTVLAEDQCSIPVHQINALTQEHSSESLRRQTEGSALPYSGLCPELLQFHDVSIFLKPKTQGHSEASSLLELPRQL